jgi:hypothetical protein
MQQNEIKYQTPAFPPQIAQDNFNRVFAPIPGMSKLEFFAIQLLPLFIKMSKEKPLTLDGKSISALDSAIFNAKLLIDKCNPETEQSSTPIINIENK